MGAALGTDQAATIRDFYGCDPLKGEDARLALLAARDDASLRRLLEFELAANNSHQVELRLQNLTAAIGPAAIPALIKIIRSDSWYAMGAAAAGFGGLIGSDAAEGPLIETLKQGTSIDVHRMAVEALGYLRADRRSYELREFARTSEWGPQGRVFDDDSYAFEKLSPYVLVALVRFAGHAEDNYRRNRLHDHMRDFARLIDEKHPGSSPSGYERIERTAYALSAGSVDPLLRMWNEDESEAWRGLTCDLLAAIRSVRSAGFLLGVATNPSLSDRVRTTASVALGELRNHQVATRVAKRIQEGGPHIDRLAFAFSALRMVPADWSGTESFAEHILGFPDSELVCQLRYSLAVSGDETVKSALIDQLDSDFSLARWSAALGLARLLGAASLEHIEGRLEEADNDYERCGMAAALVLAGHVARAQDLHAYLCATPRLIELRSIWIGAILSAFKVAPAFDSRAFDLWWAAARLHTKAKPDFELKTLRAPAKPTVIPVQGEGPMLTLLAASQIAGIAGNAVSIIDKVYSQFFKIKTGAEQRSPGTAIVNQQDASQISVIAQGQNVQTITYQELADRLNDEDLGYLRAKEEALRSYFKIWLEAYPNIAKLSGMEKAREKVKLDEVATAMGTELADILDFIELRCGLALDDHYQAIRSAARG